MPAISMFYGIIIYMYFMDNKQHKAPHMLGIKNMKWLFLYLMASYWKVAFQMQRWNFFRRG